MAAGRFTIIFKFDNCHMSLSSNRTLISNHITYELWNVAHIWVIIIDFHDSIVNKI